MATIVTRAGKGAPLSHVEVDANFTNLNTDKAELAGATFTGPISATNLSGENTGDQTSIVGITGTKAQFDTAVTDGNFLYVGDVTSNANHTGDATGATALTLATVNGNVGSFGSATQVAQFTVNAKGLITAAAAVAIASEWTTVKLASDETSTSATPAVTALSFTPAANTRYEIEALVLTQSEVAGIAVSPGIEWPTGIDADASAAFITAPNGVAGQVVRFSPAGDATRAAASTLTAIDVSYLASVRALLLAGPTPSGNFGVTISAETGGNTVHFMAGSILKYRVIP